MDMIARKQFKDSSGNIHIPSESIFSIFCAFCTGYQSENGPECSLNCEEGHDYHWYGTKSKESMEVTSA